MRSTMAVSIEHALLENSAMATSGPLGRNGGSRDQAPLSDAELLAEIGRSLTEVYVEFLQQPMPRRTAEVLSQIKVAFQA